MCHSIDARALSGRLAEEVAPDARPGVGWGGGTSFNVVSPARRNNAFNSTLNLK